MGRRASVTPASGEPGPRALERRVAPLHAACHPGLPSTAPRPGPTSLSETQQPGSIPFFFPPEERGRLDGSPTVPTPQRPPPAPLPVAGSNHGGRENGTTPPRPPTPHGRSGGPSPLLPSQSLERGGPGHPRFLQAGPVAGLHGVGGAVHGSAVEVSLRVGVAAVPEASPGQAAAPRGGRRWRGGGLLVLEELVLPQLRRVVLLLMPPQMLGGFETPAVPGAVTAAGAVAAARQRGRTAAAAVLCLHAAGGRVAGPGRRQPPSSGQRRGNCAEKLDSSCRTAPRPGVGAAGAAAPPSPPGHSGGEAGRGGGSGGEGLASRSEIFKAGLEPAQGGAELAVGWDRRGQCSGVCRRRERARRGARPSPAQGRTGTRSARRGVSPRRCSSPPSPRALRECFLPSWRRGSRRHHTEVWLLPGRDSLPEGLALQSDGRWQSCSRSSSPRTLRCAKTGFLLPKLRHP